MKTVLCIEIEPLYLNNQPLLRYEVVYEMFEHKAVIFAYCIMHVLHRIANNCKTNVLFLGFTFCYHLTN